MNPLPSTLGLVTRPVVVLVGLPGAGKTTIGQLLATRLGVEFRDVDADIEAGAGKPISEIFIDEGEQTFRALEAEATSAALTDHSGVVALGGGAVLNPITRGQLAQHTVVYLKVDVPEAVHRVGLAQNRPVLALNPRATLRELAQQRQPLYEEVAMYTVDTSNQSQREIVEELATFLERQGE